MRIVEYFLSDEGRRIARAALIAAYPYLVRWQNADDFDSVRVNGLAPRTIGCDRTVDRKAIKAAFGGKVPPILCLSEPMKPQSPMETGVFMQFAIQSQDLPECVLLDWTFGVSWHLPDVLLGDGTCHSPESAFCETFRRHRSVAVIEPIPANHLRVRLIDSQSADPRKWPSVQQVEPSQIYVCKF